MSQNESNASKYPHYFKSVKNLDYIDVYRVLQLFEVTDQAVGHAVKKLLCAGSRGSKDFLVDITEAYHTLNRVIEMQAETAPKPDKVSTVWDRAGEVPVPPDIELKKDACPLGEQSSGVANFGGVPVAPASMFPPRPNPNWMDEKSSLVQPVDVIGDPLNRPIADIKHSVGEATSKAAQALQASLVGTAAPVTEEEIARMQEWIEKTQQVGAKLAEAVVVTEAPPKGMDALELLLFYNTSPDPAIPAIKSAMIDAVKRYTLQMEQGQTHANSLKIANSALRHSLAHLGVLKHFKLDDFEFFNVFAKIVEKLK